MLPAATRDGPNTVLPATERAGPGLIPCCLLHCTKYYNHPHFSVNVEITKMRAHLSAKVNVYKNRIYFNAKVPSLQVSESVIFPESNSHGHQSK